MFIKKRCSKTQDTSTHESEQLAFCEFHHAFFIG